MMPSEDDVIQQFLLIYDRKHRRLISSDSYGEDIEAATEAYRAAELFYHDQPHIDIVLVGSDSLETIKRTHSTYFHSFTVADLDRLVASLNRG